MGDFMNKCISVIITFLILFSCTINVCAQSTATIVTDVVNQDTKEEQIISIHINNNPGIMGFKLHFDYPEDSIEVISAHKGEVTQKGNLNHNIGNKNGSFDVMWNNTSDTILNGPIVVLRVKSLTDKPFKITVSYSQADTFNEQYQDVVLECNDIVSSNSLSESDEVITTEKAPDEISGITDDLLVDIISNVLKENNIKSLENINQDTKEKILIKVNQQIESITNHQNYYNSFEDLQKDYIRLLKDKLITDADSLKTEDTPKDIIDKYKEENNYENINSDNISGLVEKFEEEGLDTIYSDYLTDDELQEVFNSIAKGENSSDNGKPNNSYLYFAFFVIIFAVVICVILILRGRWKKREKQQN